MLFVDFLSSQRVVFGFCELDENPEVFHLAFQLEEGMDFGAQRRDLFDLFLRLFFVGPEIGLRHQPFKLGETRFEFGEVKDTSGARRRGL